MKKLISSVFVAFLAISLMAQTPVTLKLNLEKGKVYKVKNTSKQVMQITAGGQQINMDITSNLKEEHRLNLYVMRILKILIKLE